MIGFATPPPKVIAYCFPGDLGFFFPSIKSMRKTRSYQCNDHVCLPQFLSCVLIFDCFPFPVSTLCFDPSSTWEVHIGSRVTRIHVSRTKVEKQEVAVNGWEKGLQKFCKYKSWLRLCNQLQASALSDTSDKSDPPPDTGH